MKPSIPIVVIAVLVFSVSCERESGDIVQQFTALPTVLGGCNGQEFDLKRTKEDTQSDTVIISTSGDTLSIFVGLNYICCAPFITETQIGQDSILLAIIDTCSFPYQTCYCRCMCYYTFDFQFINFEPTPYPLQIMLYDPQSEEPGVLYNSSFIP